MQVPNLITENSVKIILKTHHSLSSIFLLQPTVEICTKNVTTGMISDQMGLHSCGSFRRDSRRKDMRRDTLTAHELAGDPDLSTSAHGFSGHHGQESKQQPRIRYNLHPH